jgi:ABC-2 type transport system permease protein
MAGYRDHCLERAFSDVMNEAEKGLRALLARPASLVMSIISAPLWLAFFVLSLEGYGLSLRGSTLQLLIWVSYSFSLYSTWLWEFGHGILDEQQEGVLEYVLGSGSSLFKHVLGSGLAFLIYSLLDMVIILASFSLVFGVKPLIINPALLAASIVLASASLLSVASIYSILVAGLRSSWVVTDILQFVLPAIGGLLPSEFSPAIRVINSNSPLAYPFVLMREGATGINELGTPIMTQLMLATAFTAILLGLSWLFLFMADKRLRRDGRLGLR